MLQVTLEDVKQARETIKDIVKKTDVLESTKLSEKTGAHVYYKCENLQKTGSFKVRGACNKIANLTEEEKARGVREYFLQCNRWWRNGRTDHDWKSSSDKFEIESGCCATRRY